LKEILAAIILEKWGGCQPDADKAGWFEQDNRDLAQVEAGTEAQKIAKLYTESQKSMIIADGNTLSAEAVQLLGSMACINSKTGSTGNGVIIITSGSNQNGLSKLGVAYDSNLISSLRQGEVSSLFILGEDPVGGGLLSSEQIARTELTVVVTPFMTATAAAAHVVLPAAAPLETMGTYIRCDGLAQTIHPVRPAPAGVNNHTIISRLAAALGSAKLLVTDLP
ncbi:MAG: molybdopterin-dependent oxidoreductase, partial [Syntrophomonas sp.]